MLTERQLHLKQFIFFCRSAVREKEKKKQHVFCSKLWSRELSNLKAVSHAYLAARGAFKSLKSLLDIVLLAKISTTINEPFTQKKKKVFSLEKKTQQEAHSYTAIKATSIQKATEAIWGLSVFVLFVFWRQD